MKQLILSLLLCRVAGAAPDSPQWKIVETKYPTPDTVVAGYNVLDFGALGDGKTDCTMPFQQAMDGMARAGGGTVFVPEGRYVIKGTLQIPTSVTLRGEWAAPTVSSPAVKGTVLMAYAGRGDTNGTPFISVSQCAGIKDLSIWYPEQTAEDIVAYLRRLKEHLGGSLTILWDGSNVHDRSKLVRAYLAEHPEIVTERLPAYAPETNPDELVWAWTKYSRLGNLAASNAAWLRDYLVTEMNYLRRHPEMLASFIDHTELDLPP